MVFPTHGYRGVTLLMTDDFHDDVYLGDALILATSILATPLSWRRLVCSFDFGLDVDFDFDSGQRPRAGRLP